MKRTINLTLLAKLFLAQAGNMMKIKNGDNVFCFPFYRQRLSIKIALAIFYLVTVTATFAQDANSYYEQGITKVREGNLDEAIKLFDKTISLNTGHYMARLERGRANLSSRSFKQALADFDLAVKLDPRYYEGWLLRGLAKYNLADYKGAIADYTQSIFLHPGSIWGYYDRGFAYEALGRMDAACADYKKALGLGLSIARQKVDMCNGKSKNTDVHLTVIQRADSYYDEGYNKAISGKFEESIKLLDSTISLKADYFMAWIDRAYCKSKLGLFKEAITDYDQAIKLSPLYVDAWHDRGVAKYSAGDYEGALTDYNHAIVLDSNNAGAYYNRGLVYIKLSRKDSACTDFNTALRLGFAEAKDAIEMCNNMQNTIDNNSIIILYTDGVNEKLLVSAPHLSTKDEKTFYIIPFWLMLSSPLTDSSGTINSTYTAQLKPDPSTSIDIHLNNGFVINLSNVPGGKISQLVKMLGFLAILNENQKTLLSENNIESIDFKTIDATYTCSIKAENASRFKNLLTSLSSKQ